METNFTVTLHIPELERLAAAIEAQTAALLAPANPTPAAGAMISTPPTQIPTAGTVPTASTAAHNTPIPFAQPQQPAYPGAISSQASSAVPTAQAPAAPPIPAQAAPTAPIAPAAPAVPTTIPTAAPAQYTHDAIKTAAAPLVRMNRTDDLFGLLGKYGVQGVDNLPADALGAFAADLRSLGVQI